MDPLVKKSNDWEKREFNWLRLQEYKLRISQIQACCLEAQTIS